MVIRDLVEGTFDNMAVLRDCVELLIRNLPYQFPANQTIWLAGVNLNGLDAIINKYKGTPYETTINSIKLMAFAFRNTEALIQSGTVGAYRAKPDMMVLINVSAFMRSAEAVRVEDVLRQYRAELPIKTFKAILLHELRHVFQSFSYEPYYYGRGNREDLLYKKSPVEIDAAWSHHLQDFDVTQYPDANSYTDAVMASFASYKSLTPPQYDHYRRKTLRYYVEMIGRVGRQPDPLAQPAGQRLVANRTATRQWLSAAINQLGGDIDLRNLPGYNPQATRFFFPQNAVRATAGMIAQDKTIKPEAAPIAFLVASLAITPDKGPEVIRHLRGVQKITPQQAIAYADNSFTGGWDTEAMKRQISSVFGNGMVAEVVVGNAGEETFMLHDLPQSVDNRRIARQNQTGTPSMMPPQIGYKLRFGDRMDGIVDGEPKLPTAARRRTIPAPAFNNGDHKGVVGSMVPS